MLAALLIISAFQRCSWRRGAVARRSSNISMRRRQRKNHQPNEAKNWESTAINLNMYIAVFFVP